MTRGRKKIKGIDPAYLLKQKEALRRKYRKAVLFNSKEMAAINEYCRRFNVKSMSALIRQATLERVLDELDKNQPTLF